jgi:Sodium:sulfate symporter transmembrane region
MAGYVILIMAIYWLTEALPLAVTSLIPVVYFPLFGIMSTTSVTMAYMKNTNMMFLGSLMVALSIEYCNLHKRIALRVLTLIGSSPRRSIIDFHITIYDIFQQLIVKAYAGLHGGYCFLVHVDIEHGHHCYGNSLNEFNK